jgi:hypothetical protein
LTVNGFIGAAKRSGVKRNLGRPAAFGAKWEKT